MFHYYESHLASWPVTVGLVRTWHKPCISELRGPPSMFSRSVVSTLRLCGLQHPGPPCPSPSPRAGSDAKSVMPSNHLVLCCPLLLLPSILPSIRVLSNELTLHQMAKVLELQLQHQSFWWIFRTDSEGCNKLFIPPPHFTYEETKA